jgi:hypothetical protein
LCAKEKSKQELERQIEKFFNRIHPMAPPKQWKWKTTTKTSKPTEVAATEEKEAIMTKVPTETDLYQSDQST